MQLLLVRIRRYQPAGNRESQEGLYYLGDRQPQTEKYLGLPTGDL
jgi:hypothetical protein